MLTTMNIKVLGPGCLNCKTLASRTKEALEQLKIEAQIDKIEDYKDIASYGIMKTPALVIDGKIAISGSVPTVEKIKELLNAHRSGS
jgi:small redox-active disulfide protein 2